jgi:menaquinone-dependent protoporphyrinogen oxidase
MKRRDFLKGATLLLAAEAFAFGQGLSTQPEGKGGTTRAILYGTRYGATRDTAGWIAEGMGGDVPLYDIEKLSDAGELRRYSELVIGSGIWIDGPHKELLKLMETHPGLAGKVVASFVVCGTTPDSEAGRQRIAGYLQRLHAPLPEIPRYHRAFGGRLIITRLSEQDRKLLENFYTRIIKKPFVAWDRTDPDGARSFGKIII